MTKLILLKMQDLRVCDNKFKDIYQMIHIACYVNFLFKIFGYLLARPKPIALYIADPFC